jgi:hypothetical protein
MGQENFTDPKWEEINYYYLDDWGPTQQIYQTGPQAGQIDTSKCNLFNPEWGKHSS